MQYQPSVLMLWIHSCYQYSSNFKLKPWFDCTTAFLGKKILKYRMSSIAYPRDIKIILYKKKKKKLKPSVFWPIVAQISDYSLFRVSDEFTIFTNCTTNQKKDTKNVIVIMPAFIQRGVTCRVSQNKSVNRGC